MRLDHLEQLEHLLLNVVVRRPGARLGLRTLEGFRIVGVLLLQALQRRGGSRRAPSGRLALELSDQPADGRRREIELRRRRRRHVFANGEPLLHRRSAVTGRRSTGPQAAINAELARRRDRRSTLQAACDEGVQDTQLQLVSSKRRLPIRPTDRPTDTHSTIQPDPPTDRPTDRPTVTPPHLGL